MAGVGALESLAPAETVWEEEEPELVKQVLAERAPVAPELVGRDRVEAVLALLAPEVVASVEPAEWVGAEWVEAEWAAPVVSHPAMC